MIKYIILFLFSSTFLLASKSSLILENSSIYSNFNIDYFIDSTNSSNIEHISEKKELFKKTTSNFAFGYIKDTLWLKIELKNISNHENFILSINEHFYEKANLYYFDNSWQKIENGFFLSLEKRGVQTPKLSYHVDIPKNDSKTIYIELQGKYSYFGNILIYEKEYFINHQFLSIHTFFIFSFGILAIIAIFYIFLWLNLKEKIYLYYIGYILCAAIYLLNISGLLAYIDLQYYVYKFHSFSGFTVIFLSLFSMIYFNTKKHLKLANLILTILNYLILLFAIMLFFSYTPWNKLINHVISLSSIVLIVTATIMYFKGKHHLKYYLFAILLYFISVLLFTLMLGGVLEYNFFTRYSYLFAFCIEIAIFTLILANRYNEIKNKQIKTQNQLIDLQNNQNELLEKEVIKQTENLQITNEKLSILVKERELLIKEVFHRVKNNFHIINAFLWFESKKEENKSNFSELINRIKSMSLIHEHLCNSKNLADIDIKEYLDELIKTIVQTYNTDNIITDVEVDSFHIDFEYIMLLGMIINEIISNSIKHHPKNTDILLNISCLKKEERIFLTIKDNGIGFSKHDSSGLGIELIKDFTNKLPESKYSFTKNEGTIFKLIFKDTNNVNN